MSLGLKPLVSSYRDAVPVWFPAVKSLLLTHYDGGPVRFFAYQLSPDITSFKCLDGRILDPYRYPGPKVLHLTHFEAESSLREFLKSDYWDLVAADFQPLDPTVWTACARWVSYFQCSLPTSFTEELQLLGVSML